MDDEEFGGYGGEEGELAPREPSVEDLVQLCRDLNSSGCRYLVVGGFAIIGAGYNRRTMDIDFLVDASLENEEKVYRVLEALPDQAVKQLDRGDIAKFTVVRVADEIVVDLMQSACGIDYAEASNEIVVRVVDGVPIPFASPRLLWRMKARTHRAKDEPDLVFLREYFRSRGEQPPQV
jgi:hypothetical protein